MRRNGTWHGRDLNLEIIEPLTRSLLKSWCTVFQSDLFSGFKRSFDRKIETLLKNFTDSIPESLKTRAADQVDACRDIVKDGMDMILEDVQRAMDIVQKTASRSLLPHVRDKLKPGYLRVLQERGPGAIARQRVSTDRSAHDLQLTHPCSRIVSWKLLMDARMMCLWELQRCSSVSLIEGWNLSVRSLKNLRLDWQSRFVPLHNANDRD